MEEESGLCNPKYLETEPKVVNQDFYCSFIYFKICIIFDLGCHLSVYLH